MILENNPFRVLSKFTKLCRRSLTQAALSLSLSLLQKLYSAHTVLIYSVCPKCIYTYTHYGLFTNVASTTIMPIITIAINQPTSRLVDLTSRLQCRVSSQPFCRPSGRPDLLVVSCNCFTHTVMKNVLHDIKMTLNIVFQKLEPTPLYVKYNVHATKLGYFVNRKFDHIILVENRPVSFNGSRIFYGSSLEMLIIR